MHSKILWIDQPELYSKLGYYHFSGTQKNLLTGKSDSAKSIPQVSWEIANEKLGMDRPHSRSGFHFNTNTKNPPGRSFLCGRRDRILPAGVEIRRSMAYFYSSGSGLLFFAEPNCWLSVCQLGSTRICSSGSLLVGIDNHAPSSSGHPVFGNKGNRDSRQKSNGLTSDSGNGSQFGNLAEFGSFSFLPRTSRCFDSRLESKVPVGSMVSLRCFADSWIEHSFSRIPCSLFLDSMAFE